VRGAGADVDLKAHSWGLVEAQYHLMRINVGPQRAAEQVPRAPHYRTRREALSPPTVLHGELGSKLWRVVLPKEA